jgi:hypothetical protein
MVPALLDPELPVQKCVENCFFRNIRVNDRPPALRPSLESNTGSLSTIDEFFYSRDLSPTWAIIELNICGIIAYVLANAKLSSSSTVEFFSVDCVI